MSVKYDEIIIIGKYINVLRIFMGITRSYFLTC